MKRLERRVRALEKRLVRTKLEPFIVGVRDCPRPGPGERLVLDYTDGGMITWNCRTTSDPEDNGVHNACPGGYITECLRRRRAGESSWLLPWEEEGLYFRL